MKFYILMPEPLQPFYRKELKSYDRELRIGNVNSAWCHLERAHIIGQRYPFTHSFVHWEMLKFGFKIKSGKEIVGQIPRLVFGGIKSFIGKIPVGNPGGANVPPLKPFPIEKELQAIFDKAGVV